MKFVTGTLLALGLTPAALIQAATPTYLRIGDPAPSITSATWIKGAPVPAFVKGRTYVVEFWATWCGPCRESIPHITELAKSYRGKVDFIGIDIWESQKSGGGDVLAKVKRFVKDQGAKMTYHVAADGADGRIADAWMKAASEGGIPCAFIVNGEGKVAWIGHPAKMEESLKEVLAGRYDLATARTRRETELEITRPIEEAMGAKDYPRAAKVIATALEKRPNLEQNLAYQQLVALYHCDLDRGIARSREILTSSDHAQGAYWMMMAIFATETDLSPAAYAFGKQLVSDVQARGMGNYMFDAMASDLWFNTGDKAESIRLGEKALAAAEKDPNATAANLALIRKHLDLHKAAK
jgi:thiol-disulfide isomerase/thioredoxin